MTGKPFTETEVLDRLREAGVVEAKPNWARCGTWQRC
jgi:hypothetical protein